MRFRRNRLFMGILHLGLVSAVYACSEDDDSGLGSSGTGGKASSGGSTATAGSATAGSAAGGSGNTGNTTGKGGSGNTGNVEACPGLPFDDLGSGGDPGDPGGAGGMSGGGAPAGGAPAGGAPAGGGAGGDPGAGGGSAGALPQEICVGVAQEAERQEVDMFIMLDASQSMGYELEGGSTRWEALTEAVQEFALSPAAEDIGAGIGFFSISGIGDDDLDCSAADYADPVVGIGPLVDTGEEIVAAMQDKTPAGLTPMVPALEGAITYAKSWAEDHPDRATVVVLVSDGYPTQCSNAPEDVADAAAAGYDSAPYVKTYVIGVGDVARFNLNNYANQGGTDEAFLTDDNANASESFVEALLNITDTEIACEYRIPEPPDENTQIDVDRVQVVYTPQGGDPEEVPRVDNLGDCADAENGGWYYDTLPEPTRIFVCPCTCARFGAGAVDIRLGCEPRLGLR